MRKAINFDIDTKKYQEYTGKSASNAYIQIRNFFLRMDLNIDKDQVTFQITLYMID